MQPPVIELKNVFLTLTGGSGEVNILKGVDLFVHQQETLALVGPSGSGKTTTLMIMAGLERPSSGEVRIGGTLLNTMSEDDLARFRRETMGIVFQSFHLIPSMTALENTALPLEFARVPKAMERAREALDAVGIVDRSGHYPAQLSGGEQQRVALARAFVGHPRVILADEPTGNLDQETGVRVMQMLLELHRAYGTSLVLITHDLTLADLCSRKARMVSGRVETDAEFSHA
ncbi:MAG: ABC transporter ATP-binding protein [Desulfoplanes sp.]